MENLTTTGKLRQTKLDSFTALVITSESQHHFGIGSPHRRRSCYESHITFCQSEMAAADRVEWEVGAEDWSQTPERAVPKSPISTAELPESNKSGPGSAAVLGSHECKWIKMIDVQGLQHKHFSACFSSLLTVINVALSNPNTLF